MNRSTGRLFYVILSGLVLTVLIICSVPAASASRGARPTIAPAMPSEEPPPTNTPTPLPTVSPLYFSTPGGPTCVGGGCTLPSGYNVIASPVLNNQSLQAYDPKTGSVFGTGRVETTIKVNGAGISTVRVYYGLSGVNCTAGHSLDITKASGNVNHPNVPLSGYLDVPLNSSDRGAFNIFTRCFTSGSYVGNFGISSVWYSLIDVATPTPTATATLTSTPTNTPTPIPTTPPPSSNYDRVAAVNYADQWAHDRNGNYPNFGSGCNCNDCTNYSSQVLHNGNYPLRMGNEDPDSPFEWWYKDFGLWYTNSKTWSAANWFNLYVHQYNYEFEINPPLSTLQGGDFIVMDLRDNEYPDEPPDGIPDHIRVVVGGGYTSTNQNDYECNDPPQTPPPTTMDLLTDQHCPDRRHVAWDYNLVLGYHNLWYIHVIY